MQSVGVHAHGVVDVRLCMCVVNVCNHVRDEPVCHVGDCRGAGIKQWRGIGLGALCGCVIHLQHT